MNQRLIRIGKISTIDYEAGMASVTYPEMDGNTTDKFPVFSLTGEYKMPTVGQEVLVLHLPTGQASGVILGGMWNKKNIPPKSGEHIFRKELGDEPEEAYLEYDRSDGDLKLKDKNTGPVTLAELLGLAETDKHKREFGDEPGEAYIEYRPQEGRLYFKDKRAGLVSLSQILGLSEKEELKDPDPEPDTGQDTGQNPEDNQNQGQTGGQNG